MHKRYQQNFDLQQHFDFRPRAIFSCTKGKIALAVLTCATGNNTKSDLQPHCSKNRTRPTGTKIHRREGVGSTFDQERFSPAPRQISLAQTKTSITQRVCTLRGRLNHRSVPNLTEHSIRAISSPPRGKIALELFY